MEIRINRSKITSGLTMIELVITLFVLTVAVIGVYNAFSIMVVATSQMSDRFIAAYLAQEGIEITRNIRDNNWINDKDWTASLLCNQSLLPCDFEADYMAGSGAPGDTGLKPWSGDGNYLSQDNNFYNYNQSATPTKFKRKITVKQVNDHTLQITATVTWDEKQNIVNMDFFNPGVLPTGSITAEEYLYNWY